MNKPNPVANQKYMSIAVSVVREQRYSAQTFVVRGQDNARKSATAYISEPLAPTIRAAQTDVNDSFLQLDSGRFSVGRTILSGGQFLI